MNRIKLVAILAVLGIAAFVAMSSIYTVSEVEQAIITQFGAPPWSVEEPETPLFVVSKRSPGGA